MEEDQFRQVIGSSLVPMLGATVGGNSLTNQISGRRVSYIDPSRISVRPEPNTQYKIILERSQKFSKTEKRLAGEFMLELARISRSSNVHFNELLKNLPRRVIAQHLSGGQVLLSTLEMLEGWAARTYEGQRITAAIGIRRDSSNGSVSLDEFSRAEFAPVVTNGFDTILVLGSNGRIDSIQQLDDASEAGFGPYRLAQIASWTATTGRCCAVLNRHGEILLFHGGDLRFAKRAGSWLHYTHEVVVRRMSPPNRTDLRRALYDSFLDVSFARTGGCIGVLLSNSRISNYASASDRLGIGATVKSRLFDEAIGANFQTLDRRFRQELLALDGAMILDHRGGVLAVGAIVEIQAGSAGGGRLAAAQRLSEGGLGIKISEDGGIKGFRDRSEVFVV